MLYIWLLQYFCVLHTVCSLVVIHIGNLVMHIYCIWLLMPFLISSFIYIHNSGVFFLHLVVTCIEAHIFAPGFSIPHIFISIIRLFYCFILLGQMLTWDIQHSTTHIQHHLCTNFDQISSFHLSHLATHSSNPWH